MRGPIRRTVGGAIDRAVLAAMKAASRYPTDDDWIRLRGELRTAHAVYGREGLLARPADFHPLPPRLASPEVRTGWLPNVKFARLAFRSDYAPHPDDQVHARWHSYAANHIGHAYVLEHDDPTRPWLICLHGLGTGTPWLDFPGFRARHLHRNLGLNLLFPVMPLHGPRRAPGMERSAMLSFELVNTIHGLAQAVWDTRRLIGWARDRGARAVGVFGISMGAYAASLVSSLEPLDLVIAGIPLCDVPTLFNFHSPASIRRRAHRQEVLGEHVRELYRLVSPLALSTATPHARRFIFAGNADRISTPTQARMLWDAWDRPAIHWFDGGHVSYFWSAQVHRFIDDALALLTEEPK